MSHRLRPLAVPFLVKPRRGVRVRSRLRVSDRDALVLWALGLYLGGLANQDLGVRCAQGPAGGDGRTERKRALTGEASSRWAGAITRTSNDQWERGLRNLRDQRLGLQRAIAAIERRLALPVGERGGRRRGYAGQAERFQKQRRLQLLKARLAQLEARLGAGRVSVTRGGRELARLRHHLEPAGLSQARWRERWEAERLFISADGEADKYLGNETMRWHPEQQWLEIKLPGRLAFLANRPHGRYRLDCQVSFRHRGSEVASQAGAGAIRYDISYQPEPGRWYLDASWRLPAGPLPELKGVLSAGVLGVDLNAGHLAAWVVDQDGIPAPETPVRQLSLGQRMRGELTAALLHGPEVLFLDEPTVGLDIVSKARVRDFLEDLNRQQGVTVLLTTHDLSDIERLCPHMLIIDHGRVLYDGGTAEIAARFGAERTLVVDLAQTRPALYLAHASVVRTDGPRQWIRFRSEETTAAALISAVSEQAQLVDLSIEEPDIEEVMRRVYMGEAVPA